MKLYSRIASALAVCAAALLSASCVQEMKDQQMPEFITGITVTGQDVGFSEFETKVSYTDRLAFSWNVGDRLGIFPIGGKQQEFPLSDIGNGSSANFDGGAWALRSSYEYAGYYPYSTDKSDTFDMMLPVDYSHQKQIGNMSTANLGEYSYMVSEATQPNAAGSVNLQMKQVGGVVRAEAMVPADVEIVSATLVDNSAEMIVGGQVDLGRKRSGSTFVPVIEEPVYGDRVVIDFEDVVIEESTDGSNNLIFYFWMAPQDLTGHELSLVLEDVNGYEYVADITSNVEVVVAKGKRIDFGEVEEPTDVNYLCFTAVDGSVDVDFVIENPAEWEAPSIQYSLDKRNWSAMDMTVRLEDGESMYFRGNNEGFNERPAYELGDETEQIGRHAHFVFNGSGRIAASGNVMTLLDRRGTRESVTDYAFYHLFENCAKLIAAPELPATVLAPNCYEGMFEGCTSLTVAPALPAVKMEDLCYYNMFADCTALISAPELPAMELGYGCYHNMFKGCTNLTIAPELPATDLAHDCYIGMFEDCTSLTDAPALSAMSLAGWCYNGMFSGCTSLTSAPALPATTLTSGCYNSMFARCTSLTTAPELPADTLAPYCYDQIFTCCTSLTVAPELPVTNIEDHCYAHMFSGCTSLTVAPELPATTLENCCYFCMFTECTSLTSAPELPAKELAVSCYGSMFRGCTNLVVAPELPATELVNDCYGSMFSGCRNLNKVSAAFLNVPEDVDAFNVECKWLDGVAETGTFFKNPNATWTREEAQIPEGWAIVTGTGATGEDLDPEW